MQIEIKDFLFFLLWKVQNGIFCLRHNVFEIPMSFINFGCDEEKIRRLNFNDEVFKFNWLLSRKCF